MRYLLIAAIIFLIGMLLTALPSSRQMRLGKLRQQAMRAGMQVRAHNTEQLQLLQDQVAYFLPMNEEVEHWRLLRISRLNSRQAERNESLPHIASGRLGLDGWLEEGQVPAVSEQARRRLGDLLAALPDGVDAIGAGSIGVFVIWDEQGDAATLERIAAALKWLEQAA